MTHGTDVPAGWYRDPLGTPQLRWWNATAWTEHVAELNSPRTPPSFLGAQEDPEMIAAIRAQESEPLVIHAVTRVRDTVPATVSSPSRSATAVLPEAEQLATSAANVSLPAATWNALNRALTEAVHSAAEPLVELRFADAPTLVIDPRGRLYWWADSIENLSLTSSDSDVKTVPRPLGIHHNDAGRDWEPLVWLVGTQAEPESFDPLSLSGARFKLRRWPNLTTLKHTTDQMSMTAMLGAASLTVTELATLAQVEPNDARRLVSTFELMGLLAHTADTTAGSNQMPATAQAHKDGIFSRLKARFSR